jgi:predicted negative regulator of RcsB-dependent stress response
MAKKEEHKHELLENPEALKERLAGAEVWLESNPKVVIGVALGILLIVGGYFGFHYYKKSQDQQGAERNVSGCFLFRG